MYGYAAIHPILLSRTTNAVVSPRRAVQAQFRFMAKTKSEATKSANTFGASKLVGFGVVVRFVYLQDVDHFPLFDFCCDLGNAFAELYSSCMPYNQDVWEDASSSDQLAALA